MPMSQGNVFSGPAGLQCLAWVVFNGTTGAISKSQNIASLVRTAVGTYTVTFTTAMPSTQYFIRARLGVYDGGAAVAMGDTLAVGSFRLQTFPTGGINDAPHCQIEIWA